MSDVTWGVIAAATVLVAGYVIWLLTRDES
jgi:hypothetical protein